MTTMFGLQVLLRIYFILGKNCHTHTYLYLRYVTTVAAKPLETLIFRDIF